MWLTDKKLNIYGCGNYTTLFIATGANIVLLMLDLLPQA